MKGGYDKTNVMLLIIIALLIIIIIMITFKFHSKLSEGFITNKTANGEKCSSNEDCISNNCVNTSERGMVCLNKPPPPLK
jgi:hypothetical protein